MMKRFLFLAVVLAVLSAFFIGPIAQAQQVIKVSAKQFEYSPSEITLKKGVPVVLEFTSLDRLHGFYCPELDIRTDIEPGKVSRLEVTPTKAGSFPFHCDNFCGSAHGKMRGTIIVTE